MKYRAEVDGLRALAVVPVILFHAGFEIFSGGYIGVDVFFVISGYLITTILIDDIEKEKLSIIKFYERRARRILPALFAMLFVSTIAAYALFYPSNLEDFSKSLAYVILFLSNIFFWKNTDYFATEAELTPLLHTWSLAVEEQFYLLFPIFLILAWRFGKNRVFWMIVIMSVVSLFLSEWGWRNSSVANFYLAPSRAWELFAGSIFAFTVQKRGVQKNESLALLGLTLIILSIFVYDTSTPFPSVYSMVPVLGVGLILLFAEKGTLVSRLLSIKVFVGIGIISYSAYLWHQPLFAFSRLLYGINLSVVISLMLIILTFILALLSWKYIEQPFRDKRKFTSNQIFKYTFLTSFLFLIIISILLLTKGASYRFQFPAQPEPWTDIKCHGSKKISQYENPLEECLGSDDNRTNGNIYLIGDSHAAQLTFALQSVAKKRKVDFYFINTESQDEYPNSFWRKSVTTDKLLEYLLSVSSANDYFVTSFHRGHLNPRRDSHYPKDRLLAFSGKAEMFLMNMERYLPKFQKKGINVVLVKDGPLLNDIDTTIEACMFRYVNDGVSSCRIAYNKDNDTRFLQSAIFDELARKYFNTSTIDFLPELYDDGFFSPISSNGEYLMFDRHHLTENASLSLIDFFDAKIIPQNRLTDK